MWALRPLMQNIGDIVSAGCLAHDMGNPLDIREKRPFHRIFRKKRFAILKQKYGITDSQWNDIINFEGNANAFRLLTHQFGGHRPGGFVMTYSTLASIVKYPYKSDYIAGAKKTKFGFFQRRKMTM